MYLCMCFLWQLGQRVIANHLMVLTFQQDRTVCSGSVFFFIYIYFARISKADQDCCLTYNCYLWPGLFCYYSQEGSCLFKNFGDISLVRTWLSFWEIWRHARVVRLFSKHVRQSFFFFFFWQSKCVFWLSSQWLMIKGVLTRISTCVKCVCVCN